MYCLKSSGRYSGNPSIGSMSLNSYLKTFGVPLSLSASAIAPCMATPRIEPICTRPEGVFSSRITIGPLGPNLFITSCAIRSAQNMGLFYLKNLVFLRTAGGVEGKLIPLLFTQQCGAQGRVVRNFAGEHVGLLCPDDGVDVFVLAAQLLHGYGRAHPDRVGL